MRLIQTSFLFFTLLFTQTIYSQEIEQKIHHLIDSIYKANSESIGILVHVEAPDHGISWSGSTGYTQKEKVQLLTPKQPALIASSIKTYVAATIIKLVELEKLKLNQSIKTLLSEKTTKLFTNDAYNFDSIQVIHLLSHTSGIADYVNDEYFDFIDKNKNYRWTRDEQLQRAVDVGNPLSKAGTHFKYADANFLLLTEIIEESTGQPFHTAMRDLLEFKKLGLNDTWFPSLEEKPKKSTQQAHQYFSSKGWDTYDIDISWDLYGGGGIASTTKDMAKFLYHYFNNDIVKTPAIKEQIFTEVRTREREIHSYYMGLYKDNYHGLIAYGHGGLWGSNMLFFPSLNTSISVIVLERDQRALIRPIMGEIVSVLKKEILSPKTTNDELLAYTNELKSFSGSILIAHNDSILVQKAYGKSSVELNASNTIETKYNIASISKMITAVATLQLHEKGLLDLNQTIGTYLPHYPNAKVRDSVKIVQLLNHSSGIPPFYGKKYLESNKLNNKEPKDYLPLFVNDTLLFSPGSQYNYTGSAFVVLGLIIEELSLQSYYEYTTEHIFRKANMLNTVAIPTDSIVSFKANGYTSKWGAINHYARNDHYISIASPAGGHYSTIEDLFHFSKALRSNNLLNEENTKLLFTPNIRGYNTHLGYGVDIDQRYNEIITGHSSRWFGIRAELMDFTGSDYTVVVLSNKDDHEDKGASKVIEDLKVIIAGKKR
ncbi:MAG: serine hydrolase [Flavobacteriales bacterium]|nr:serine hydrolase [Flavobacteriales bacterium]